MLSPLSHAGSRPSVTNVTLTICLASQRVDGSAHVHPRRRAWRGLISGLELIIAAGVRRDHPNHRPGLNRIHDFLRATVKLLPSEVANLRPVRYLAGQFSLFGTDTPCLRSMIFGIEISQCGHNNLPIEYWSPVFEPASCDTLLNYPFWVKTRKWNILPPIEIIYYK